MKDRVRTFICCLTPQVGTVASTELGRSPALHWDQLSSAALPGASELVFTISVSSEVYVADTILAKGPFIIAVSAFISFIRWLTYQKMLCWWFVYGVSWVSYIGFGSSAHSNVMSTVSLVVAKIGSYITSALAEIPHLGR